MQILYTSTEREDARLAASAVRSVAPDVRLVWAARLSDAGHWVSENKDRLAAIVVDADVQNQSCLPFVRLVRTLGLTTPILVVVPEGAERPVDVLEAGADEIVPKNESFGAHVARVVRESLQREQNDGRLQTLAADNERLRETEARLQARLADVLRLLQTRDGDVEAATARTRALESELADAVDARRALEEQRAELQNTFEALVHRSARERIEAAQQAAERQSEFEAALADASARYDALDRDLASARAELGRQIAEREQDLVRLREERAASDVTRAEAESAYRTLEEQRAELQKTFDALVQRAADERFTAAELAAQQQSAFETALADANARCDALDRDLTSARENLVQQIAEREQDRVRLQQERAASDEKRADAESAHRVLEQERAELEKACKAVEQQLRDEQQRCARVQQDLAAAAAKLAAQQHEYDTQLAEQAIARKALEQQLCDVEARLERVRRESTSNAAAAADRLSRKESELSAASAVRLALEQRLVEAETALAHARERGLAERAAAVKQTARQQAEFDAQRGELETQLAREVDARHAAERDHIQASERLAQVHATEIERLASDHAEEIERLANSHREEIEHLVSNHAAALERLQRDHASERQRVEALVAERDAQLSDQAARHDAAQHAARQSFATLEGELRATLTAQNGQIDELHRELQALTQELTATRSHRDALQLDAHRAPALARQLAAARAEAKQHFAQIPVNILRCTPEGVLQEANHAMVSTLGYRTMDQLRALDFPASIFEFGEDLRWLVQRCQEGPRHLADCILKKKDGTRVSMRLRATQMSAETIEIVAEDLTVVRALEEQLRQAHRMEAVGRLASEVASTCDDLLRNVGESGQQLLASLRHDPPLHHQAQSIFGDVARAAGFMRQLSGYGQQQSIALSPADVDKVLREMEPVLKRVAGNDIELDLPKKTSALLVDVDTERVERVLVNVAAYGRARMPFGGHLTMDLSRVAVNREFVAKHPNVREGGHALIRVGLRDLFPDAPRGAVSDRPGLDLSALQALIGGCGGHLWMNAEPGGDMEMKIRLPLRSAERHAQVPGSASVNAVARWFQS
jgi:chromosome segregation ATPase